ncbi:MAG: hypothetical protein DELT_01881 [Desulfovibrio sp.]
MKKAMKTLLRLRMVTALSTDAPTMLLTGLLALLLTLLLPLLLTGLFAGLLAVPYAHASPIAVTVSIPPQKYFVEAVGGDDVVVTVMTGKGRDPHSYEPTAAQMEGISKAEVYIAIGVPFETQWLPKFAALNPAMRTVFLLRGVERITGQPDLALRDSGGARFARSEKKEDTHDGCAHHHHGLEGDDPHIWLSPKVMADTIPAIVQALAKARPGKAAAFEERGKKLTAKTLQLDSDITALFASLPAERRTFLTFHQSWAYYARNYGLREAAVELEGREIGPKSMALLIDFAKKNAITVIVSDPTTNKSALAAVAKSLNAKTLAATPLEEDWPASMRGFSEKLAKAMQGE